MRFRNKSTDSTQSDPSEGSKKKKLDPRWKVRIQALVIIALLVIPGNLGTLIIYLTIEEGI